MNLHRIAKGVTRAIAPPVQVVIRRSLGATEDTTGRVIPQYATPINTEGDKRSLTGKDIYRLQSQNVQGVVCSMYLEGNYEALFRVMGKGGDLLTFEGQTYLVASVLERWPDWCLLALAMQLDGPNPA